MTDSPPSIVTVANPSETYASGFQALKHVDLTIRRGEIFALLGPNGAGKTTLIGISCGIVNPSEGSVVADGHDIVRELRAARSKLGLVPQELSTDALNVGISLGAILGFRAVCLIVIWRSSQTGHKLTS